MTTPHPTKWLVHVEGPDDVIEFDTEQEARRTADAVNSLAERLLTGPLDPKIRAVVYPPGSPVIGASS